MESKFLKVSFSTGTNTESIGYIIKEFVQDGNTFYLIVETLYKPCEILIVNPNRITKFHSYWHL
jgi:hypothetical protein